MARHFQFRLRSACLSLSILVATALPAAATSAPANELACHPMLLLRVVDGDTVYGYIDTSDPEVAVKTKLRLVGIDTPETGGRARCSEERQKGQEARDFLRSLLDPAIKVPERVRACAIASDKYAARRLGRLEVVADDAWVDIGTLLISSGLAFAYDGGKRGDAWCTCLKSGTCPAGYPPSAK